MNSFASVSRAAIALVIATRAYKTRTLVMGVIWGAWLIDALLLRGEKDFLRQSIDEAFRYGPTSPLSITTEYEVQPRISSE